MTSLQDPASTFRQEREQAIKTYPALTEWQNLSMQWMQNAFAHKYMYNFECLGRPIIQTPIDMVAIQELIWDVKPDLIIETGIAHGGSLVLSAACLALIDYCEAAVSGKVLDPKNPARTVIGIDIDIREHNKKAIEEHPLAHRIKMIQGSSVSQETFAKVRQLANGANRIMVFLDSNHTHDHVLEELKLYAPLTSKDSYCIVFDTLVEDLPENTFPNRPWSPGNNPKTAVHEYLQQLKSTPQNGIDGSPLGFEIDKSRENKLLLSVAPDGYLKRV